MHASSLLRTFFLAGALTLAGTSSFQNSAHAARKGSSIRVAYIDMQEAILLTEEGKSARENMEKEIKKKKEDLMSQEKELKKMQEDFQSQMSVLSDDAKNTKQRDFQKKAENYQNARMTFEQDAREKEMQETQKIIKKMQPIIDDISKKNSYDLVFERSAGGLVYAENPANITQDVVKIYNSKHKAK